ncbi:MAG: YgaP-like transmembrane domain [Planctomycetaceae bacterium]
MLESVRGESDAAEIRSHLSRQAVTANGLLLLAGSVLAMLPATSTWGRVLTIFMAVSLVFSGLSGFCGWLGILRRMPWNRTEKNPDG